MRNRWHFVCELIINKRIIDLPLLKISVMCIRTRLLYVLRFHTKTQKKCLWLLQIKSTAFVYFSNSLWLLRYWWIRQPANLSNIRPWPYFKYLVLCISIIALFSFSTVVVKIRDKTTSSSECQRTTKTSLLQLRLPRKTHSKYNIFVLIQNVDSRSLSLSSHHLVH